MTSVLKWFDDSGNAALAAVAVSVVSVIVSVVALRRSSRTQRRLLEIEEQREEDRVSQTRKATLVAAISREPSQAHRTPNFYLEVKNSGLASARNIVISLDDEPVLEHPAVPQGQDEVKTVGPKSAFRYMLAPSFSTNLPKNMKITWDDDSGERGKYETTLT